MTAHNYFDEIPDGDDERLGQRIYKAALVGRRGFRPDQLGIEEEDEIWLEIFRAMGASSR